MITKNIHNDQWDVSRLCNNWGEKFNQRMLIYVNDLHSEWRQSREKTRKKNCDNYACVYIVILKCKKISNFQKTKNHWNNTIRNELWAKSSFYLLRILKKVTAWNFFFFWFCGFIFPNKDDENAFDAFTFASNALPSHSFFRSKLWNLVWIAI